MKKNECIFCLIVAQKIPAAYIMSSEEGVIIKDIDPKAEIHWLIIPRRHFEDMRVLNMNDGPLIASLMLLGLEAIRTHGNNTAFRIVVNNGKEVGQQVFHSHIHLLGGTWHNTENW